MKKVNTKHKHKKSCGRFIPPELMGPRCSWKGDKLAGALCPKVRSELKEVGVTTDDTPSECAARFEDDRVIETEYDRRKRWIRNGRIIEIRY